MRAAKVDKNQSEVVKALRADGCFVQSLATVGSGCPDILAGKMGIWRILEIKDGEKPPSQRKLTPDQVKWHAEAGKYAPVYVVESVEQALKIVNGDSDARK